jgi:hypothetical protein
MRSEVKWKSDVCTSGKTHTKNIINSSYECAHCIHLKYTRSLTLRMSSMRWSNPIWLRTAWGFSGAPSDGRIGSGSAVRCPSLLANSRRNWSHRGQISRTDPRQTAYKIFEPKCLRWYLIVHDSAVTMWSHTFYNSRGKIIIETPSERKESTNRCWSTVKSMGPGLNFKLKMKLKLKSESKLREKTPAANREGYVWAAETNPKTHAARSGCYKFRWRLPLRGRISAGLSTPNMPAPTSQVTGA